MKTEIEAMPQLIHLSDAEVEKHRKQLEQLYKDGSLEFVETYNGVGKLYFADNGFLGSWSLFVADTLIYFVIVKKIALFTGEAVRQVLVKRFKFEPTSEGIAQYVIFNKLLPKYKTIASDGQQSDQGAGMWSHLLGRVLKDIKYEVRLLNTNDRTEVPIHSMADLAAHKVWGTTSWYQRMILTITEK